MLVLVRALAGMRSVRFTLRGFALLGMGGASVVGAYVAGLPELLYLAAFALALPVAAVLATSRRRLQLSITRTFHPAVIMVGCPVVVELMVVNNSTSASPRLNWNDTVPWRTRVDDALGVLGSLPSSSRVTSQSGKIAVRYRLTPPRRGVFDIGPLRVTVTDPFGLSRAKAFVGTATTVLVTPVVVTLPVTALSTVSSEGRIAALQRSFGGQDDLSTREYRPGDALRRVHWRATARYGELMVRQEAVSHAEVRIILDTRRSGYRDVNRNPDRPESETFERAISVATSAALHFSQLGYTVELIELGRGHLSAVAAAAPFLRSVATLQLSEDPVARSTLPRRAVAAQGAVFAVLATGDAQIVERLGALRVGCHPAVAFVVGPEHQASLTAQSRLVATGWNAIAVSPTAAIDAVWHAAAERYRAGNVF